MPIVGSYFKKNAKLVRFITEEKSYPINIIYLVI